MREQRSSLDSPFWTYRSLRRGAVVAALLVVLSACGPATTGKLIVSANDAQDAAAHTYDLAKQQEADATRLCVAALKAKALPLPLVPADIKPFCAAVGVPVPYDPVALQKAAGPINALYDGVRAANTERLASGTDNVIQATLTNLAALFTEVVADLTNAGIALPAKVTGAAATLKGGP
jgi:hypothetical protein